MVSFELRGLPSPSTFSSSCSPPNSPTKKPKMDLSINTFFPSPGSDIKAPTTEAELDGKGQAQPLPDWIQRRKSNRETGTLRERENFTSMGISGRKDPSYAPLPFEESEYTTPTTLASLDYDTTSPSQCSHHSHIPGRSQTRYQKDLSKSRLRLLYTLIPVISVALFSLYTIMIIDHAQRNILTKIQYPGTGGLGQAQAQVKADEKPQGVWGDGSGATKGY